MVAEESASVQKLDTGPDSLGLHIAHGIQESTRPSTVILYGSRAAGDHRPDSDADILIIAQDPGAARSAETKALQWLSRSKPRIDVSITTMTEAEFDQRKHLPQSLAGQAIRHGVNSMGEKLDHSNQHDPQYEATWRETRRSLEGSETDLKDYNEREDENHWNMKNIGYEAQQALEKAMKAVLTAHNDGSRFRHDLSRMWDYVETQIPWRPDDVGTAGKTAVRELLDYVTFPDPANPGRTLNWLTAYAEAYRYEVTPQERTWEERKILQHLLNPAVRALQDQALYQMGASRDDLFPDGRPWERR